MTEKTTADPAMTGPAARGRAGQAYHSYLHDNTTPVNCQPRTLAEAEALAAEVYVAARDAALASAHYSNEFRRLWVAWVEANAYIVRLCDEEARNGD